DIWILEAEPVDITKQAGNESYNQTSQLLRYMHDMHSLKDLCQLVAEGTREITGYDRVMVYRFDKDYNGEVFAESCREDLEPFLGLHYPHTDIPPQARELYMKNLLRLITDIDYTPVPIYTLDDSAQKSLDMSLSVLRSTSPIHVQYLHNMGVGATLTISLIYKKKLWGLIACHHYSPKNLSPELRLAAQLQGHFITSQIDVRQASEEYEHSKKVSAALERMTSFSLSTESDLENIILKSELLAICNATGASIIYNNNVYNTGITPTEEQVLHLASWCATYSNHSSYNTNKLSNVLPELRNISETVSGIIYHSLDIHNINCIMWYRPETKTEVNWAGEPSKSIIKDEKGLSPRRSFALWKEIVDSTSNEWLSYELDASSGFAYSLQRQLNLIVISREEEKYRKLSELLRETNNELENINWISTHDLQEPLRKIQLIASRLLSKEKDLPETVQDAVVRMNGSAERMQTLLVDILKYTRIKNHHTPLIPVNVSQLIDDVKLDMTETIFEKNAEIITYDLPVIMGIPFLMKQLFVNLIGNSIKYASSERAPIIRIYGEKEPVYIVEGEKQMPYTLIKVTDNGIGFEPQYAEKIFNIFTRLHAQPDMRGSGVGLALCKKIMQTHNGIINAVSTKDVGTTINLYFPVV
ncbi:MAG: ATP-binding protein, partial [Flavobacterium sp.]